HTLLPLEVLLGVLGRLLDGRGNLVGLAVAGCHSALAVAHHHQCIEAEAPTALHHGRTTADLDDAIFEPVLPGVAISLSGHVTLLSPSGTRGQGDKGTRGQGARRWCPRVLTESIVVFPLVSLSPRSCPPSELKSAFAGALGQGLHSPVKLVVPAI